MFIKVAAFTESKKSINTTSGKCYNHRPIHDKRRRNAIQESRLRVYKTFSCSTQLSTKFILLINVKMPTIVGILTIISMVNTTSEKLKASHFFICRYVSFYEQRKFRDQLSWAWKTFHNPGNRSTRKVTNTSLYGPGRGKERLKSVSSATETSYKIKNFACNMSR